MNFTKLAYFVKIAETGSISRAAESLQLAQPALSRFLRGFETELNCVLFERNGRGVAMTDAGRRLYVHAKAILDHVGMAELEVAATSGPPLGTVTLGLAPMLAAAVAPALAARLQRAHPRILLKISEDLSADELHPLQTSFADLVVGFRECLLWPAETEFLMRDSIYFVVRRDLWVGREFFDFDAAAPIPIVAPPMPDPTRSRYETAARKYGATLNVVCETHSLPLCVELVNAGLCASLVPGIALRAFPPDTIALDLDVLGISSEVILATPLSRPLTSVARILRDMVIDEFKTWLQPELSWTGPLIFPLGVHPGVQ